MSAFFGFPAAAEGEETQHEVQAEDLQAVTGGRPPAKRLPIKARRKSDPPEEASQVVGSSAPEHTSLEHIFFDDHDGNRCISVWNGKIIKDGMSNRLLLFVDICRTLLMWPDQPFPPPWNYQIYVTYGITATSPETVSWCDKLYNYILRSAICGLFAGLRLDFTFLPNSLPSACVRHYRAEKRTRAGTDRTLVPTYETEGYGSLYWARNLLLLLDHEDISGQGLKFLMFDPVSEDEPEPEAEVPQWLDERPTRYRFYEQPQLPNTGWILEPIEELYKGSKARPQLEQQYRITKQEADQELS